MLSQTISTHEISYCYVALNNHYINKTGIKEKSNSTTDHAQKNSETRKPWPGLYLLILLSSLKVIKITFFHDNLFS